VNPAIRKAAALLLAAGIPLGAMPARASEGDASPPAGIEAFLAHGMPSSAERAFRAMAPAAQGASPLLPGLLRALADRGGAASALALFDSVRPHLAEPVRSETLLAVARIHWELSAYDKATPLLREVAPGSKAAPDAALYLARALAAAGDLPGADRALEAVPPGPKRALVAGEIAMLRNDAAAAAAAWKQATPDTPAGLSARLLAASRTPDARAALDDLRALAGDNGSAAPRRAAVLETLATLQLKRGEFSEALATATRGVSEADGWLAEAKALPKWDATRAGAETYWEALVRRFPLDEPWVRFFGAGRAFLSDAAVAGTALRAANGSRELSRGARWKKEGVDARRKEIAAAVGRSEAIRKSYLADRDKSLTTRARLKAAAQEVPLAALGQSIDPKGAELITATDKRSAELRERIAKLSAVVEKFISDPVRMTPLSVEDQRMVFFAQARLAKMAEEVESLDERSAFARGRVWNRWKTAYVERISRMMNASDNAANAATTGIRRASGDSSPLLTAQAELDRWAQALSTFDKIAARDASRLEGRRAALSAAAENLAETARAELVEAVRRKSRSFHYLAGRAAAEWRLAGTGAPNDNAAPGESRRAELATEALRHFEAAVPPGKEKAPWLDEALYAMGELRYEIEEARFFGKEGAGNMPDYSAAAALFKRVIDEFPSSPYGESAHYGLALALQESGSGDEAYNIMEKLLARYPASRYADEIRLRLGESSFDQNEFAIAEQHYRKVSDKAPAEIRTTALFKLGWSLFLQSRPKEAADPFLSSLLLSPKATKTGGVNQESLKMVSRMLVEAGADNTAERFLADRGASAFGPPVLIQVQGLLDTQNRHVDAAHVADRLGAGWPLAPERVDAEIAAVESLRKGKREEDAYGRRAAFLSIFGPGSAWQADPARTQAEIARADNTAEEATRVAAFHFHAKAREGAVPERARTMKLYDAYLAGFPQAAKAEEISYQRSWLLFEDGKKKDASAAFEAVGKNVTGPRAEASRYMALQAAKDVSTATDNATQAEIVRLAQAYEEAFPKGDRIYMVVMDRAVAHRNVKDYVKAAEASQVAVQAAKTVPERRAALRIGADSRFDAADYAGAETGYRALLATSLEGKEKAEVENWTGFSMFRHAEQIQKEKGLEAADLFLKLSKEFPAHEIATVSRFRAGSAYADGGKTREAIDAFLFVEAAQGDKNKDLRLDSTRWLARLYEKNGEPLPAADRVEQLAGIAKEPPEREALLLKAVDLAEKGKDTPRKHRLLLSVAALPTTANPLRMHCLTRVADDELAAGKVEEADKRYGEVIAVYRTAKDAAPELAGKAFFRQGENRFAKYLAIKIVPPLEQTFAAKQNALTACAALYAEAVETGDNETVSGALHRIGEGLEEFRTAILTSPVPDGLSAVEKEEYGLLLEEKAAPIEEKAIEAYRKTLYHSVAAGASDDWSDKSLARLRAMRPARYGKKGEYAFPVLSLPDFRGIVERSAP
jgi:tetratricopeptide (TPR) repeat protein